MKQNYPLYHKTVHCSRNNDFLSKIEIEIGIDRYRSSFRFLGREEGGGGSTNSVSGKIRLKVIKAARRRAGRSGNGRANERVSGSRLKGSHPLRPTLPLPPRLSINHNYILSLPSYRS